jgi:hypothetical protein
MATLTVTHTETLTLDNRDRSASKSFTLDVDNLYERTLSVANTAVTIAVFKDSENDAAGAIDLQEAKYIRITNTDTADILLLTFGIDANENNTAADEHFSVAVAAGESFVLGTPHNFATASNESEADPIALHDIVTIQAQNATDITSLKVEIYVAGKES